MRGDGDHGGSSSHRQCTALLRQVKEQVKVDRARLAAEAPSAQAETVAALLECGVHPAYPQPAPGARGSRHPALVECDAVVTAERAARKALNRRESSKKEKKAQDGGGTLYRVRPRTS